MQWFLTLPISSQLVLIYIVFINVLTFFYFGMDKLKAHWSSRRVRERVLWGLALVGGSVGALLGMHFFRHKTKKLSFQAGMAVIIAVQVWVVYILS